MKDANNREEPNKSEIINETVISLIINNIISSVIRITNNKIIYKELGSHCFNYLIKLINPYLKTEYLPYENISNSNHDKEKIFYNSSINQNSDIWVSVTEPQAPKIDSFSNRINISKFNNNTNNKEEENSNLSEDIDNKYNKDIKNNINIASLGSKNVREEMDRMIEMPSFDISNDNKNTMKNDEFAKLRKEYLNLKLKKNKIEENNNLFMIGNKNKRGTKKLKSIFIKFFDNNRLTFDPNGKVIHLNLPKLSPISNEFNSPKQKIINKLDYENMKRANRIISVKKPMITSFEKYNFKSNENMKDTLKINNDSKNKKENNNELSKDNNDVNKDENNIEKIEYNPSDHKSSFYYNKFSNKRKKLIIGGTNFEKIIPEVGVIIHNDEKKNQKKYGGFQYSRKYNRPSLSELSKIIDNNNKKTRSVNISSLSFNSENNENNNNYFGYNEEFNENNNPLFQNAHFINNKERIFSSFSNNKNNNEINNNTIDINNRSNKINLKRNLKSSFNNLSYRYKSKENSLDNIILSPKKNINDIYNLLIVEEKNQLNENNKSHFDKDKTSKNVMSIKELINLKRKFPIIDELNKKRDLVKGRKIISKFNANIIKNKNWGNNYNLDKKENTKNLSPIIHFRKEIFPKMKIGEESQLNPKKERNNKIRRIFHSSSTGELIS